MKLNFARYGEGPPIIVLHGLLGSSRNWAGIARSLAETHAVYVLDARNHGESPRSPTMSYPEMAEDVQAFIAEENLVAPVVLGHSMGGKTAMTLALDHGAALGGLIVADIAPVAYRPRFMEQVDALRALDLAALDRRADADAALAQAVPEQAVRAFLLHNLVAEDGAYRWRADLDAIAANVEALAGFPDWGGDVLYSGPTLILRGERSDYVRTKHHAEIRRLFPEAGIGMIAEAGHWLHVDRPEAFLARIRAFLTAV